MGKDINIAIMYKYSWLVIVHATVHEYSVQLQSSEWMIDNVSVHISKMH